MFNKLIGTKELYKKIFALMIPIMIQNGITNFVSMLDNIMVGQVGTLQMTGVAVTNQLLLVFNLCIFGAVSGAGIFGAQFFGKKDYTGMRDTFRFKIVSTVLLTVLSFAVFLNFGDALIASFLKGENGSPEDSAAALGYARDYLRIMLIGLIPYSLVQSYASTLREAGEAKAPMAAGILAVLVNLGLNYVLIFGHFGLPALGVDGAAIATVISRFVELAFIIIWSKRHYDITVFFQGAFSSFRVPWKLASAIIKKGLPLTLNETCWAAGMAMQSQCFSVRGLDVVAANNIAQTFWNVFSVAFLSIGAAIGIILGQMLGAGDTEGAKRDSGRLIAFSVFISAVVGLIFFAFTGIIPKAYNTTDEVRTMATSLMKICALAMPLDAFANAAYFTLRSGGQAFVTFIFDSCFVWAVNVPVAFVLSRYTDMDILTLYLISQLLPILKDIIGYMFVKKGLWIRNIVSD